MLLYGFPEAISEEEVEVQVSIPTLVLHAGQSESAIEKSIADLVSVGLVRRVRRQNTSSLSYLYRQPGCWDGPPAEETVPRQGAIRTMRARTARKAAPERLMMSVPFQPNQIRSARKDTRSARTHGMKARVTRGLSRSAGASKRRARGSCLPRPNLYRQAASQACPRNKKPQHPSRAAACRGEPSGGSNTPARLPRRCETVPCHGSTQNRGRHRRGADGSSQRTRGPWAPTAHTRWMPKLMGAKYSPAMLHRLWPQMNATLLPAPMQTAPQSTWKKRPKRLPGDRWGMHQRSCGPTSINFTPA